MDELWIIYAGWILNAITVIVLRIRMWWNKEDDEEFGILLFFSAFPYLMASGLLLIWLDDLPTPSIIKRINKWRDDAYEERKKDHLNKNIEQ